MLAEKLLLQILIVITPVLLYLILFENKKVFRSPYLCGLLQGLSAILCMLFSYHSCGHNWDLRYIPLILSILYGGPIAGAMVLGITISGRLLMGGDQLLLGLGSCFISIIPPFMIVRKFFTFSPKKRIMISLLVAGWPMLISGVIFATSYNERSPFVPFDILLFGLLFIIGITLTAKLNELVIERSQMKASMLRAEKLNILGELAASVAHEVRNPLTVVKGFLQLMKQKENAKDYEYLTLILSELGRAESIINDYLNFAKPQFDKMEAVPLVEVIQEVIFLLEPLALKDGIMLESQFDETHPIIYTDRNQLKQALVNFIKNAIEATSVGGCVSVKIISSDEENSRVLITDTGKGMDKEQLSRIGTLFYTTKDKGTGLGTTVSMKIIETMNGKVIYTSTPGIGTEVTLLLPILKKESLDNS
ncbi:MAG TPA: ATP-binding protein [Pseudoneobacillus sp.]|nr:ATP-binding protein [Pseudoneobacillus sp.]